MGEEEGYRNKKSDVASLGRKLKLHLLVYIIDAWLYNLLFIWEDEILLPEYWIISLDV